MSARLVFSIMMLFFAAAPFCKVAFGASKVPINEIKAIAYELAK